MEYVGINKLNEVNIMTKLLSKWSSKYETTFSMAVK